MGGERWPSRIGAGDRGAATVAAIGLAAAAIGLAAMLAGVTGIPVARHRAVAAVDAAALAAAAIVAGFGSGLGDEPCGVAAAILDRHGVVLHACVVDGLVVTIDASAATPFGAVSARATAGPPGMP